jgi:polysaccharide deacetylase 2 family uncharacterized protein YibQ
MFLFKKKKKKRKAVKKKKRTTKKSKAKILNRLKLFLGLLVLFITTGFGVYSWSGTISGKSALLQMGANRYHGEVRQNIDNALSNLLSQYGASNSTYFYIDGNDSISCLTVSVPEGVSFWEAARAIEKSIKPIGASLLWGERLEKPASPWRRNRAKGRELEVMRIDLGVQGIATHTLVLYPKETVKVDVRWQQPSDLMTAVSLLGPTDIPTIALVVDDWGYFDNSRTKSLLNLNVPFTMAIIPGQSFSRRFALQGTELALPELASSEGPLKQRLDRGCPVRFSLSGAAQDLMVRRREIILHLPMEPVDSNVNAGKNPVTTETSSEEIGKILDSAINSLPGIVGVNNHMGSKATADQETMQKLMAELKKRDLFFLDSRTTRSSVAEQEAQNGNIPYLFNWTFLDQGESSEQEVQRLLGQLVRAARRNGMVVGICHPHANTVAVLKKEIPDLVNSGIRFVTLSEMFALQEASVQD